MIYVSIGNLQIKWSEGWSQNTSLSDTRAAAAAAGRGGEGD